MPGVRMQKIEESVRPAFAEQAWLRGPAGVYLGPVFLKNLKNDLNFAIERCKLMTYAADTKIYTSNPNPQVVEENINRDLANTLHWFQRNGMKANPEKYQAFVL